MIAYLDASALVKRHLVERGSREMIERAKTLAWDHALRGYDDVHVSSAHTWLGSVGTDTVVATIDTQLWKAARQASMKTSPGTLRTRSDRRGAGRRA